MTDNTKSNSIYTVYRKFKGDKMALFGLIGIIMLFLVALVAPLIANGRPLILYRNGCLSSPMLYFFFAPDSSEVIVEKLFNYLLIFLPLAFAVSFIFRNYRIKIKLIILSVIAVLLLFPFIVCKYRLDKTNWRQVHKNLKDGEFAIFTPVPYGPFENVSPPYQKPSFKHWFGTDQIGRDVLSRMCYGARVSLAVGILATAIALIIGIIVGMLAGYFGGLTDMFLMRIVEIIICFPTFLLLLILMAVMMDRKFDQSILMVIAIIGITGWTGLSRLVRGEVLKLRSLPYIQSCIALGLPVPRIMFFHLLPNITGIIMVNFTFSIAGAILAESGLSFLGFGVQAPTASWGELLKQAFADPFQYWHLTLWPGLALFIAVTAFNFTGEGLRRLFDPRTQK